MLDGTIGIHITPIILTTTTMLILVTILTMEGIGDGATADLIMEIPLLSITDHVERVVIMGQEGMD